MAEGDLIQFIDFCEALSISSIGFKSKNYQVPLWPTARIYPGEIGIILKSQYCKEIGTLCDILIGNDVFVDVPSSKIDYLPAPAA